MNISINLIRIIGISLWLLWAAVLFGGFLLGKPNAENTRRIPLWNRLGSSLILVAAAWFIALTAPNLTLWNNNFSYSGLFFCAAIGMTLGCLGDFFMAQMFRIKNYVLGGIGSFGLGHVAYILGIITVYQQTDTPLINALPMMLIGWLIALALWYLIVFRGSEKSFLHYAALPYALLLASTAGLATAAVQLSNQLLIDVLEVQLSVAALWSPATMAVGAILFLISDLILATRLFNHAHWRMIDDVVWLTYGPGQMLIVYSLIAPFLILF